MSSHSIHLIDTNQSDCEGVKKRFEVCQWNPDNWSNYKVWTTCFMIRGDHWLSSRVQIIGVRIISSSTSAMVRVLGRDLKYIDNSMVWKNYVLLYVETKNLKVSEISS